MGDFKTFKRELLNTKTYTEIHFENQELMKRAEDRRRQREHNVRQVAKRVKAKRNVPPPPAPQKKRKRARRTTPPPPPALEAESKPTAPPAPIQCTQQQKPETRRSSVRGRR